MKTEEIIFMIMLFLICFLIASLVISLYKIKKLHKHYQKRLDEVSFHFWHDKYFLETKSGKTYFGNIMQILSQTINPFSETENSYDLITLMIDATICGLETKEQCELHLRRVNDMMQYNAGEIK